MNEAYEVELSQITASFITGPFTLILGVERQTTLKVEGDDKVQGFTDVEWQIIYTRALVDNRWFFLPQSLYDEIDDEHGEEIGNLLWQLTCSL